jgi:heparosan-N-sulfate-glucuronate 5-epimerase
VAPTLARLRSPRLPIGPSIEPDGIRGYYIDFRSKNASAAWPPEWFPWPGFHRFMGVAQWGLGAFERYLLGEGEDWLAASTAAARHIVEHQERSGLLRGGWFEPRGHRHTFTTPAPWLSAMAQGQCASLLVRVGKEIGADELLESAANGLRSLVVPVDAGGVAARLDGGLFLEEYPTDPPSFVLNGAIFALWGAFDVGRALGDELATRIFSEAGDVLAANLERWDTGFWSRYDLYPHQVDNVASPFYHALHIEQLEAMNRIAPAPAYAALAGRFREQAASAPNRARALVQKAAFRLVVRKGLHRA